MARPAGVGSRSPSSGSLSSDEPVELVAHDPRVLQELELTRDVRVEADEMQAARRLVDGAGARASCGDRPDRIRGHAAARDESEPRTSGRRESALRQSRASRRTYASGPDGTARKIRVARIRAADVRAERTSNALRIVVVGETLFCGAPGAAFSIPSIGAAAGGTSGSPLRRRPTKALPRAAVARRCRERYRNPRSPDVRSSCARRGTCRCGRVAPAGVVFGGKQRSAAPPGSISGRSV